MSVQRFDSYGYMPSPEGKNMRYDDHARIVAEATAEARAAERRHWEARFRNAEAAHAAALADANLRWDAEVTRALDEGEKIGRLYGSTPRTLTADDPEPAVTSVGLDRDQSVWQRVGSTEHSRWVNPFMGTREWSDVLARGPVRLIHDGEDR